LKIIVIVCNSGQKLQKTIDSIKRQSKQPDQIILIDNEVESIVLKVRNLNVKPLKSLEKLHHFHEVILQLEDSDIVVVIDGGDELAHDAVLQEVKELYIDERVWLTYGGYLKYPSFERGSCFQIDFIDLLQRKVRLYEIEKLHLKTFYAGLFKKIDIKDLQFRGSFFKEAIDSAMMLPMLEMAEEKAFFWKTPCYLCQNVEIESTFPEMDYIRKLSPYSPVDTFLNL